MAQSDDRHDYDLTCWYLNLRRVAELVGIDFDDSKLATLASISNLHNQLQTLATHAYFKSRLAAWLPLRSRLRSISSS
ncbi:hypothetical protein [Lichenihabitans psoromatis]|uniref:hypothetical protein n=1 Tax=Lichenihabitans psoromatis TaxID=2528642 RepID=UPI0010362695|nr:hypothetical protein [Lichenihabitans psoromatis]